MTAPADELIDGAVEDYADLDPRRVGEELRHAADALVAAAAGDRALWSAGITIGTARCDVRFLLAHALHDSQHHLVDVERGLSSIRAHRG